MSRGREKGNRCTGLATLIYQVSSNEAFGNLHSNLDYRVAEDTRQRYTGGDTAGSQGGEGKSRGTVVRGRGLCEVASRQPRGPGVG